MDAFDADILIFVAQGDPRGRAARFLLENTTLSSECIGSVVLITEVFGRAADRVADTETQNLLTILAKVELKEVDHETASLAATMRSKYRLGTPDAIHLATAVRWGADRFHTNNSKDFGRYIDEIEIVLPHP